MIVHRSILLYYWNISFFFCCCCLPIIVIYFSFLIAIQFFLFFENCFVSQLIRFDSVAISIDRFGILTNKHRKQRWTKYRDKNSKWKMLQQHTKNINYKVVLKRTDSEIVRIKWKSKRGKNKTITTQ